MFVKHIQNINVEDLSEYNTAEYVQKLKEISKRKEKIKEEGEYEESFSKLDLAASITGISPLKEGFVSPRPPLLKGLKPPLPQNRSGIKPTLGLIKKFGESPKK